MRSLLLTAGAAVLGAGLSLSALPAAAAPDAATGGRDDNATVCAAVGDTVTDGMTDFLDHMTAVQTQAGAGDLVGAEESVKEAGAELISLGGRLHNNADNADDPALAGVVDDLATEFENLGKSLTGLSALQNFDTTELDALADELGKTCGEPLPGVTPSAVPSAVPSGSATPSVTTS